MNKSYRFNTFQEFLEIVPVHRQAICLNDLGVSFDFLADYIIDVNGIEWIDSGVN